MKLTKPIIRKALAQDIDAIVRLNTQLADYHRKIDDYYKPGEQTAGGFRQFLQKIIEDENYSVLVAVVEDKTVAYFLGMIAGAKPFLVPEKTGRISDAFVMENYRHLGIGKLMFEKLIDWFGSNHIKHIELSVDARNTIGIKAWKKFGFQEFMLKMKMKI